jgi:hypothetical protein
VPRAVFELRQNQQLGGALLQSLVVIARESHMCE